MKVMLFGEGNTDVTTVPKEHRGALDVLLSRILEAGGETCEVIGSRVPRRHEMQKGQPGYPGKVDLAIAKAHANGADGVAFVVDRDGDTMRLKLLDDGRTRARDKTNAPHAALAWRTAIGVAVEMLEAWLLADTNALSKVVSATGAQQNPESIRDPKGRLNELLDEAALEVAAAYEAIAEAADISEIERRCPAFQAFAQEVREFLLQRRQ
jgi:hypothetical protein